MLQVPSFVRADYVTHALRYFVFFMLHWNALRNVSLFLKENSTLQLNLTLLGTSDKSKQIVNLKKKSHCCFPHYLAEMAM